MSATMSTRPAAPRASWSDEDRARAEHYALFGRLFFAAPDAALLEAIVASAGALGAGDSPLARAWAALGETARQMGESAIADEFEALFCGVGRQAVLPYGSYYLTGFMMEEPLADLRDDLAALGLGRRGGVAETEDHVGALCEVMRHLVLTGPDEEGLARQRRFFTRHIAGWAGRFTDELEATPGAAFYARLAALLSAFLEIETQAFAMD